MSAALDGSMCPSYLCTLGKYLPCLEFRVHLSGKTDQLGSLTQDKKVISCVSTICTVVVSVKKKKKKKSFPVNSFSTLKEELLLRVPPKKPFQNLFLMDQN